MHVVLVAATAALLNSMTSLLSARGHDVTCFDDPLRALDHIGANDQAEALMVASQFDSMPAAEICWEARLLASYERPLYICLVTRPLGSVGLTEVLDCGADDVLQMPIHADELYARLRAAERMARMQRELLTMATRDGLTGLLNRSAFFKRGAQLCLSRSASVAAIMVDIDHFKRVNDTYGHAAGDEAIRFVASKLDDGKAIVGRLGGEEFAILTADEDPQAAACRAETLREKIAAQRIKVGAAEISLSCSLGVSAWQAGDDIDRLLRRADDALYLAKTTGRNRVAVYGDGATHGLANPQSVLRGVPRNDANQGAPDNLAPDPSPIEARGLLSTTTCCCVRPDAGQCLV